MQEEEQSNLPPVDFEAAFPEVDRYLHAPLLTEPPMCTLNQLQDGTYSIDDLHLMNEIIEYKYIRRLQ